MPTGLSEWSRIFFNCAPVNPRLIPVSYTHLDVYKRQVYHTHLIAYKVKIWQCQVLTDAQFRTETVFFTILRSIRQNLALPNLDQMCIRDRP